MLDLVIGYDGRPAHVVCVRVVVEEMCALGGVTAHGSGSQILS